MYHFDVIGSFQRETYRADGTAQALIQPLLDNQVGLKNLNIPADQRPVMTLDRALAIVRDAFTAATERDIYTGDAVDVFIVTREGVRKERFELKKD